MNQYKILVFHDHHGDITGIKFFENDVLRTQHGFEDCSSPTEIKRDGNWDGPMWVIYNTLLSAMPVSLR